MPGSLSNYAERKVLNHIFGGATSGQPFTAPTTLYLGLFTVPPGDDNSGTEVVGGSYARVAVTNTVANWPEVTGTDQAKTNANAIQYPTATADWGTVVAVGIYDAATAGNLIAWGDLNTVQVINTGGDARVAPGAISISMN